MIITERPDSKKNALRQNITEVIDRETGNITQEITDITVQFRQESAYVKIYIDNLCAVAKALDSLNDVLFLILRNLDYDGYIAISTRYRKEYCKLVGIKYGTLGNRM